MASSLPSAAGLSADLRKRIEIMAEHIARNGPDFESTVRLKNAANPQFAFLYNGEGAEYYSEVLAANRGSVPAAGEGPSGLTDLAALLRRWKEPPLYPLASDLDRQLQEVAASLEAMASRDAIRNGRAWVECNSAMAPQIASSITRGLPYLRSCAHRLHVLYLVHDVLQTEAARKDSPRHLIRAFRPYLPWMLRPCYQLAVAAAPAGEDGGRVLRLLELWVERGILEPSEAVEMRALIVARELPGVAPSPAVAGTDASPLLHAGAAGLHHGAPGGGQQQHQQQGGYPVAMPQQMAMAPRLQGYRPLVPNLAGKQTPETVPVGVLATMMMHAIRRAGRQNFIPYRPLDTSLTPQMLPPMEVPSQRLLERVEDFYQDLRDEERDSSSSRSRSSSRSSGSSSRSRSRTPTGARGAAVGALGGASMSSVPPPAVF